MVDWTIPTTHHRVPMIVVLSIGVLGRRRDSIIRIQSTVPSIHTVTKCVDERIRNNRRDDSDTSWMMMMTTT